MLSSLGIIGLAASLILAAVFAAAGIGKLADRSGTQVAIREFGSPTNLVRPLGLGIPFAELAVAVLLLYGSTRAVGGAGALGLIALFSAAIAFSLARGRAPECHCFGQLHSAPASWKTLVRNGVLAVLGAVALGSGLAGETPGMFTWMRGVGAEAMLAIIGVVAVAVLAGGARAYLALLRSYGSVLLRLDGIERRLAEAGIEVEDQDELPGVGLAPGTPAPAFVTADTTGESISLDGLLAPGLPLLLLFTGSSCGPCSALLPTVAGWQGAHADRVTIAVVHGSDRDTGRATAEEHGLERVLVDQELAVFEAYEAESTPNAVLVSADGRVASWVAQGEDGIRDLLARALEAPDDEVDGLTIGSPAPELGLQAPDGTTITLETIAGRDTLLLFWNPACGFCSSMRDEVLVWEQTAPPTAPQLLVISSGDADSTEAEGFTSLVALDHAFDAGSAFGAGGTPMAVLIDREGNIGSPLAAGAEAVFALAGARDLPAPSSSSENKAAVIAT